MTWEFAPEICRSSTDAKTLWTRCSLWVTHPDLDFGTRKNRKEWRFSAELHAKLLHLLIFIYYILLLEQVYSTTFKYSIHVVRYGSVSCSGFSQPKRWGDDPVAISCNFYRPTSVLIFCTARLIN